MDSLHNGKVMTNAQAVTNDVSPAGSSQKHDEMMTNIARNC